MTGLTDVVTPDLVTETEIEGSRIATRFVGCADTAAVEEIRALVEALHRVACAEGIEEVLLDVRTLEFVSASCLAVLAGWLGVATRSSTYLVCFVTDARLPSQSRSLDPLTQLDRARIRIEVR